MAALQHPQGSLAYLSSIGTERLDHPSSAVVFHPPMKGFKGSEHSCCGQFLPFATGKWGEPCAAMHPGGNPSNYQRISCLAHQVQSVLPRDQSHCGATVNQHKPDMADEVSPSSSSPSGEKCGCMR